MDVLFSVEPFADVELPSLSVSLLKAEIARRGFSSTIEYFNLRLAERIGLGLYKTLAHALASESLVGEWFFADVAFGDTIPNELEYADKVLSWYAPTKVVRDEILKARQCRHQFVEECVQRILDVKPAVVGFSTTFHQTCASLAVARRLKELPSPPVIIFGGANCEGEMGLQLLDSFPWVDYVCTGEGDVALPEFLRRLLRDGDPSPIPGILKRGVSKEVTWPERIGDLDSIPFPDYSDYFAQLEQSGIAVEVGARLPVETARGCWWGAKHHCTFCGLNGNSMAFRSKSPERAFEELSHLTRTYGLRRVDCVDNILDLKYVNTLFKRLADGDLGLELFYEVKANLSYAQLAQLKAGGLRLIQPGIESLSNEVLRLMKKGCTSLQNLQLLRWCEELDIRASWNLLAGFPDEPVSEYERTAELIPLLTHLQPPASFEPVRLDRFSPLYTQAAQFGLERVRPSWTYFYVYPLGRRDLSGLAYYFDFEYKDGRYPFAYLQGVKEEVQEWQARWLDGRERRPRLDAFPDGEHVVIKDTRAAAPAAERRLTGLASRVYVRCDSARSVAGLTREFGGCADESEIRRVLNELTDAALMVEAEGQYLSLAVIRDRHRWPAGDLRNVCAETQEA